MGQLQEEMTWREFIRWVWLYNDHAFGELGKDLRTADTMVFHSNLNSPKNKRKDLIFIGQGRGTDKKQGKSGQSVMPDAESAGAALRALAGSD